MMTAWKVLTDPLMIAPVGLIVVSTFCNLVLG
jgi:hypothetical protein